MRLLGTLTASQLLAVTRPESLYTRSEDTAKVEYRLLVSRWHPDVTSLATAPEVFDHVTKMYRQALELISNGKWIEPAEKVECEQHGVKRFRAVGERQSLKTIKYLVAKPYELGTCYVGNSHVTYTVDQEHLDLYERALSQIKSFKFANDKMALEMVKYLPQVVSTFKTLDQAVLVVRKTPDQLLLRDVLDHMGGVITPTGHLGWVLNVFYNLACYLQWAGVTHNAISLDTLYVSPLRHAGALLGGWWYTSPVASKLVALPPTTMVVVPPDVLRSKVADCRTDLELLRALGRELLGDVTGVRLDPSSELVRWLRLPSGGDARQDYNTWKHKILPAAFGPPKFVSLELVASDIYKES